VRSTLSIWAAALAESSWLAALVAVPIFYNVYSHETFEPDKIFLLRSLTALTLAAAIVWCVDSGRAALTVAARPLWQVPLVKPVCALTAIYLLSTVCSIAPQRSVWGSYLRAQGAYTWLSYVIIFLAIVLVAREPKRWERAVSAVLLASVPAALYAIVQHFKLDPIDWGRVPRAPSTMGNPIFLGAYLVLVLPLTLARLLVRVRHRRAYAVPYAILLVLQALALFYAQSRGPTVGFAFGLAAFVALAARLRGVRWPIFAGAAVAGLVALVVIAGAPRRAAPSGPRFARLGQLFDWHEGSERVRVLIWQGVVDLLRRDPARAVIGHGPETLLVAFAPVYPAEMATYERPNVAPDRAHNEVMDALATTGALGCLAELVLFVAFFVHTLRWLGIVATAPRRNWFVGAAVGGAVGGAATPILLGHIAFIGLGLSLGLAAGVLIYLVVLATWRVEGAAHRSDADAMLLAALFAAGFGHFVELQAGIATSTTRLYFFAFAGLAVAIGMRAGAAPAHHEHGDSTSVPPPVTGTIVALLLALLTFDLYTPTVALGRYTTPLAAIFLSTWVFGGVLVAEDSPQRASRMVATYAAFSATLWLVFVLFFVPWLEATRQQTAHATPVGELGAQLAGGVSLIYAMVCAYVGLLSVALAWRQRDGRVPGGVRWQTVAAAVAVAVPALVAVLGNLRWSRPDCLAKLGTSYEQQGAWSSAIAAHEGALLLAPAQQEYAVNLSRALITQARVVAARDPTERDANAARAVQLIEQAARADPLNPDHRSNLARLYEKWGRIGNPADRAQRFERADAAYNQALALWPANVVLWNELAVLYLERGQQQEMFDTFDQSLRLNDLFLETYVRRALVLVALHRPDDAVADYRRARRWDPQHPYSPRQLAGLYQATGQLDGALAEAQAGLADAGPQERAVLQRFIHALVVARSQTAPRS
jgi:tetratricopeptide (TPR) repeat protein/O-antigen ligase